MIKKKILILNFILISIFFFFSIYKEESYKKENTIILELAPKDPRSLMQGDYMTLNYQMRNEFNTANPSYYDSSKAFIMIEADDKGVSHYSGISPNLVKNSIKVKDVYTFDIGANSYFIKEGTSSHFDNAKYVKLYLLKSGKVRIYKLLDGNFKEL